ncbi:hypothetical protein GQR58_016761 [Nymphon striatum]|nr:hypothetical protein GQR58_016761 [Nymphon striatum]
MCSLQLPILLKFTSGPNAYNKEGRTPMLCAIANHYSIKELIEGSADINFPSRKKEDDSSTSLLLAARVKLTLRLLQNLQNGRDEAFSKLNIDNRKLLWHGTKLENVIGILSQELRVAPINAQLYPNMNVITKYSYPGIFPKKISAYYPSAASMKDTRNDINIVKLLLNKNHETEYIAYLEKVKKKEIKHKKKTELLSIESIVRKQNPQLPANVIFADELTEEEKHFKMKSNLDFNITDKNQKTVLHHLLSHFEFGSFDNLRMLQFLMCNGLKFEYEDYFPYLENGAVKIKKFLETIFEVDSSITKLPILLKFTSGPNAYNKEGRTPMLCAIANHYSIKELIEGSADINFPSRKKEDDSSTSLLLAARVKLTLRLLQNLQNGRDEAFSKLNIDNRKLLWHGTKLENVIGILSQELRVAPINAQLYPNMNVITKYSYPGIFPKKISAYYPSAASMKDTRNDINIVKLLLNKNHETEYIAYLEKVKKKEIKHKKKTELLSIESIVRKQNPQLPANVIFADELTEEEKHFKMKSNLDFNITDKNQKTVLHHLLSHFEFGSFDNLRMLQFLMCNGLKFEYEDYFPYLENGAVKIKKFLETIFEVDSSITKLPILLKFTSGPNAYNKEGRTPMLCAIANHYSIKELIEGSADINFPSRKKEDDSSTSLLLAARVKLTLRLLQNLQNGRDEAFSKLNIDNRKLLWHGTKLENVIGILSQELRILLEDLNCDPNAVEKCEDSTSLDTWNNSLHILASRGIFYALCRETSSFQPCSPILQGDLGIEGGADINLPSRKKEDDSSTSLLLAARVKHTLRLLQNLQNGRDEAFSKLNIDNRKLLWYGTKLENVIGILSQELRILLEDLNCDPNAVEKSEDSTSLDTWNNSLHILASRGIFYALPILLKFKSDPNAYNKEGRTPMLCAIANHYSIKELIEGGADINLPSRKKEDDSSTSLLLTARVKHTLRLLQNLQNGRNKAFSKLNIDNRKLLWHGTKLENVIGILSQELRVAPINAQL